MIAIRGLRRSWKPDNRWEREEKNIVTVEIVTGKDGGGEEDGGRREKVDGWERASREGRLRRPGPERRKILCGQ